MIFFVTVLRALAAMIITNAHYVGVYPTDLIANGGLLGDVIFLPYRVFVSPIRNSDFFAGTVNASHAFIRRCG